MAAAILACAGLARLLMSCQAARTCKKPPTSRAPPRASILERTDFCVDTTRNSRYYDNGLVNRLFKRGTATIPTIKDVARRAGVSPTAVSFVLNDKAEGRLGAE